MSNIGSSAIIYKLQDQLFELRNDVAALEQNTSPVYTKYLKSIEKSQETKQKKLIKWHDDEIAAAKVEYESEKYGADCDEKRMKEENVKKISDMIYFKADKIAHEFPNAFNYFASQGYSFRFNDLRKQTTNTVIPKISVLDTTLPLIDAAVIEEDLNTFTDNETEIPESLQRSGSISIQVGNMPPFSGKISDIKDTEVNLTVNGETVPLFVNSVRFGETNCTKA